MLVWSQCDSKFELTHFSEIPNTIFYFIFIDKSYKNFLKKFAAPSVPEKYGKVLFLTKMVIFLNFLGPSAPKIGSLFNMLPSFWGNTPAYQSLVKSYRIQFLPFIHVKEYINLFILYSLLSWVQFQMIAFIVFFGIFYLFATFNLKSNTTTLVIYQRH